jgi:hypothetical protein
MDDSKDNMSVDIDFAAIEADHERTLQIYKVAKDTVPESARPLIPVSNKITATGRRHFGTNPLDDCPQLVDSYEAEIMKYHNDESEEDPRGQTFPKLNPLKHIKKDIWQVHAWNEDSDEETDINAIFDRLDKRDAHASDSEFVEFTDAFDSHTSTSPKKAITSLCEKADELGVTIDKITADVAEVARDLGEVVPLITENQESLSDLKIGQVDIKKRISAIESQMATLIKSVASANEYMKIIVSHIIEKEDLT